VTVDITIEKKLWGKDLIENVTFRFLLQIHNSDKNPFLNIGSLNIQSLISLISTEQNDFMLKNGFWAEF